MYRDAKRMMLVLPLESNIIKWRRLINIIVIIMSTSLRGFCLHKLAIQYYVAGWPLNLLTIRWHIRDWLPPLALPYAIGMSNDYSTLWNVGGEFYHALHAVQLTRFQAIFWQGQTIKFPISYKHYYLSVLKFVIRTYCIAVSGTLYWRKKTLTHHMQVQVLYGTVTLTMYVQCACVHVWCIIMSVDVLFSAHLGDLGCGTLE